MGNIFKIVLSIVLVSSTCLADCDFKTGIKPLPDGNFEYSKECHNKVGTMDAKITDYKKAIDLKDLALTTADQRATNAMDLSVKMYDQLQKTDNLQKTNQWLWFGLGVLTTGAAAIAAHDLTSRH